MAAWRRFSLRDSDRGHPPPAPRLRWRRWLAVLFWTGWVLLTLMFDEEPGSRMSRLPWWQQLVVSPLMLLVLWIGLRTFRTGLSDGLRRVPGPPLLKYLAIGLPLTTLGNTLGISFGLVGQDIHPNLLLNAVFWFGAFGGILLAWYALRIFYAFESAHVFLFSGLVGVLVEQNHLVPKTLLSGDPVGAVLLAFFVLPVYGTIFASPWLIMPVDEMPRGARQPGLGAVLLFVAAPALSFYVGAFAWFMLSDLLFGTRILSS